MLILRGFFFLSSIGWWWVVSGSDGLYLWVGVAIRVRGRIHAVSSHGYSTKCVDSNLTYLVNVSRILNPNVKLCFFT